MTLFDGISVGSGSFGHLPPSNVVGLAATLAALHGARGCSWDPMPGLPPERPRRPARPHARPSLRPRYPSVPHAYAPRVPTPVLLPALLSCAAVGRSQGWGLASVWWALVAFYTTRLAGHLLRYWSLGGGVFAGGGSGAEGGGGGSGSRAKAT